MRFTGKNLLLVHEALISYEMEVRNMLVTAPDHEVGGDSYKAYEAEHLAIERLLGKVRERFETKGEKT